MFYRVALGLMLARIVRKSDNRTSAIQEEIELIEGGNLARPGLGKVFSLALDVLEPSLLCVKEATFPNRGSAPILHTIYLRMSGISSAFQTNPGWWLLITDLWVASDSSSWLQVLKAWVAMTPPRLTGPFNAVTYEGKKKKQDSLTDLTVLHIESRCCCWREFGSKIGVTSSSRRD